MFSAVVATQSSTIKSQLAIVTVCCGTMKAIIFLGAINSTSRHILPTSPFHWIKKVNKNTKKKRMGCWPLSYIPLKSICWWFYLTDKHLSLSLMCVTRLWWCHQGGTFSHFPSHYSPLIDHPLMLCWHLAIIRQRFPGEVGVGGKRSGPQEEHHLWKFWPHPLVWYWLHQFCSVCSHSKVICQLELCPMNLIKNKHVLKFG